MKGKRFARAAAVVLCAGILAFSLAGCAASADAGQGITVSGISEMKVTPDKARIDVAVVTEGKTAEACQDDNAKAANAVVEALGKLGVADESIQTTNTYLSPRYGSKSSDDTEDWVITGYEMTTSLRVSDLDIENVGVAIQACVEAGANETNGIEYYASNYDEAYQQALEDALATARGKAEGIAAASGVSLGKVVNVQESYQDTSARYLDTPLASLEEANADAGAAAKVMPGQESITAEVTVTFAIR
ncbi:MAG: SIMPL domain-containing protein [Coriobacteriia bacterium]|nr:SIMPL domain-containing protein [Coriobacteriia bacterium]